MKKSDAFLISHIYPEMQKARKGELCSAETGRTEGVTSSQIRIYFGKQVKDQVQLKARSHLQGAVSHPGSQSGLSLLAENRGKETMLRPELNEQQQQCNCSIFLYLP